MSDYRIDVREAIALPGLREGHPRAQGVVTVSIQRSRYGRDGNELKPELLWGPAIFEDVTDNAELLGALASTFAEVVRAHQAGESTQISALSGR